jgi:hypothetical protein
MNVQYSVQHNFENFHRSAFYLKNNVSKTGYCFCLQVKHIQLHSTDKSYSLSPDRKVQYLLPHVIIIKLENDRAEIL